MDRSYRSHAPILIGLFVLALVCLQGHLPVATPTDGQPQAAVPGGITAEQRAKVETILRSQQACFRSIRSIQFTATSTWQLTEAQRQAEQDRVDDERATLALETNHKAKALRVGMTRQNQRRFAVDGDEYACEERGLDYVQGADIVLAHAWNGRAYQTLETQGDETVWGSSDHRPEKTHPQWDPILNLYRFMFVPEPTPPPGQTYGLGVSERWESLAGLREWEPWAQLLPLATGYKDDAVDGHPGARVTFRSPDGFVAEVFFAADLGNFPWHQRSRREPGNWFEPYHVQQIQTCSTPTGNVVIPLRATDGTDTIEIDAATLKVNVPLDKSVFTIPDSVAYYHCLPNGVAALPPTEIAADANFAQSVVAAFCAGSLTDKMRHWLDATKLDDFDPKVMAAAGTVLRQRCGTLGNVAQASSKVVEPTSMETVWLVPADLGTFAMKLTFNNLSELAGIRFRLTDDGGWLSLRDVAGLAPAPAKP